LPKPPKGNKPPKRKIKLKPYSEPKFADAWDRTAEEYAHYLEMAAMTGAAPSMTPWLNGSTSKTPAWRPQGRHRASSSRLWSADDATPPALPPDDEDDEDGYDPADCADPNDCARVRLGGERIASHAQTAASALT
jgi:hypothetical protein